MSTSVCCLLRMDKKQQRGCDAVCVGIVMAVAVAVSTILLLLFVAPAPIPSLKRCSLARSNSERKRSYDTEPSHVWCRGVLITISHGCILGTSI